MKVLDEKHIVKKRNVLNEIHSSAMTLTEMRFFSIYLSKIHKDKPEETRVVRFPLEDFRVIMDLSSRLNIKHLQKATDGLLCKVVSLPIESEGGRYRGYTAFQLFKECTVSQDDNGEWFVEIDAHDKALPFMFGYKNRYFTYKIDNMLRLKSSNQFKMYELLKQYEGIGWRVFKVEELKNLLGISKDEYDGRWNNFKKYVIDACQKALVEHTDIKFAYASYGKKGPGGKILQLKFTIEKNEKYSDPLSLEEFIDINKAVDIDENIVDIWDMDEDDIDPDNLSKYEARLIFLRGAVAGEFTKEQLTVLCDLMAEHVPHVFNDDTKCYDHLQRKYNMLKLKASQGEIRHRFGYLKSIIGVA